MTDAVSKTNILLIEDDEDDFLLTQDFFADFDSDRAYQLKWVQTYEEGLNLLLSDDHDLCLLDYRLGARDGIELLREALQKGCTTPIVMLTGSGNRDVDQTAMRYGASDYLVKTEITSVLLERAIRYTQERHRLAQENARLYEEAKRAIELRDEVHRIVVHDLRNPLNTMGLATQLMERKLRKNPDLANFRTQLETQRICIRRMNGLIDDLLDVARLESGSLSLNRDATPPADLITEVVDEIRIQADDRGIEPQAEVDADLPLVDVDRRRMEQVLTNLIGNSLKFTPRGGTITVSATLERDTVRVAVGDTGCGISEEALPRLFDRFWQAEHGAHEGAGLGLAICKGLIEAHESQILVESTEGEGTIFSFHLPLFT